MDRVRDFSKLPTCHGCHTYITDSFVYEVGGLMWHDECLKCIGCGSHLEEKCYLKYNHLHCGNDCFSKCSPECQGCKGMLFSKDSVYRVLGFIFHEFCFKCSFCGRQLVAGDRIHGSVESGIACEEDRDKLCDDLVDSDSDFAIARLQGSSGSQILYEVHTDVNCGTELKSSESSAPQTLFVNIPETTRKYGQINYQTEGAAICPHAFPQKNRNSDCKMPTKTTQESPTKNNMADCETAAVTDSNFYDEGGEVDDSSCLEQTTKFPRRLDQEDVVNSHAPTNKKRGPRTTINAKQLETLTSAFDKAPKPNRQVREQLSKDTGLSLRVIQVWFQNRRSKVKRLNQSKESLYSSRRHSYDRLTHRYIQSDFYGRSNDRQIPNIGIMNSGINSFGQGDPSASCRLHAGYLTSNGPMVSISPNQLLEVRSPSTFSDSSSLSHRSVDAASLSLSDQSSPDHATVRSYLEELSIYPENPGMPNTRFYNPAVYSTHNYTR